MRKTDPADVPLFQVRNHHSAESGTPPHVADLTPNQYRGYFEKRVWRTGHLCVRP
jgi:hypothetical protein